MKSSSSSSRSPLSNWSLTGVSCSSSKVLLSISLPRYEELFSVSVITSAALYARSCWVSAILFEKEESVTKSIEVPTTIIIAIVISTISIALPRFLLYRLLNLSIFFNNVSIIDLLPSIVLFYFSRLIFATALSKIMSLRSIVCDAVAISRKGNPPLLPFARFRNLLLYL